MPTDERAQYGLEPTYGKCAVWQEGKKIDYQRACKPFSTKAGVLCHGLLWQSGKAWIPSQNVLYAKNVTHRITKKTNDTEIQLSLIVKSQIWDIINICAS